MKLLSLLCLTLTACAPLTPQQRTDLTVGAAKGAGRLILLAGEAYVRSQSGYAK